MPNEGQDSTCLPKMLFGHNGRLIKSQDETDLALEKLLAHLDTVSVPTRHELIECFTRIDLVWQFPIEFRKILPFYQYAYIHGIRSKPIIHKTSILFRGTDWEFALYDKPAQMEHNKMTPMNCGPVLRVEIRLRGDKLKQYLGNADKYPKTLRFEKLNDAYLNHHLSIICREVTQKTYADTSFSMTTTQFESNPVSDCTSFATEL